MTNPRFLYNRCLIDNNHASIMPGYSHLYPLLTFIGESKEE